MRKEYVMNNALMQNYEKMVLKDEVKVIHYAFGSEGEQVAVVSVDKNLTDIQKCEQAFMLTNSIHDAWWLNENVIPTFTKDGCRSTSVGDQVVIGDTKYLCANVGWEKQT